MTKSQAGQKGGTTTYQRHGSQHMAAIGRKGAQALHARYTMIPVGVSGWAFIPKQQQQEERHEY